MQKFSRVSVSLATIGMVASLGVTTGAGPAGAVTASNWQQVAQAGATQGGPPPAAGSSMVSDGTQELLVDGYNGTASFPGTWKWTGSAWSQVTPSSPSARSYAQTAYDPATGKAVLFGGQTGQNNATFYNDTLRWDPTTSTWTTVTANGSQSSPAPRAFGAFAWDQYSSQMVLFGGQNYTPSKNDPTVHGFAYGDTWVWDGSTSTWTKLNLGLPPTSPPARFGASMVYDPAVHGLVLVGGNDGTGKTLVDTWIWNGSSWKNLNLTAAQSPPARFGASIAYDQTLGEVVLYGGLAIYGPGNSQTLSDTWVFNGSSWAPAQSSPNPGPRFAAAMDYDTGTGQTLIYGGANPSANPTTTYQGDTWNYQTVQLPPPATAPGAPSGLTASGGDGQATLNWTAPSSDGGRAITGYNVYEGTAAGGESATPVNSTPVTGTTYTVRGLTNGSPYYFTVRAVNGVGTSPASNEATATPQAPALPAPPAPTAQGGYNLVASDGGVFSFGDAGFFGSAGNIRLNQPVVGMARTPDHAGYWLVARDGGIFSYGDATFEGSAGGIHLNQPIAGMAATPDGHGYWLVARDGGIFTYGDASYYGSTGGVHLASPVVGMAATADGHGYWEVLADGRVYSFGDAGKSGSVSGPLNHPIVGMAATPDGGGYWLAATDGGVFSFGDATFEGSAGAIQLNQPIVGMAATADGHGYWLVARDGGIFTYGDAGFHGSTGGTHLNAPIVGMGA